MRLCRRMLLRGVLLRWCVLLGWRMLRWCVLLRWCMLLGRRVLGWSCRPRRGLLTFGEKRNHHREQKHNRLPQENLSSVAHIHSHSCEDARLFL
jgi:hypothetical protein